MLTCKQLTQQLSSDYVDRHLTPLQNMNVGLHLLMCGHCRRFIRQLRIVKKLLLRSDETLLEANADVLAEQLINIRSETIKTTPDELKKLDSSQGS